MVSRVHYLTACFAAVAFCTIVGANAAATTIVIDDFTNDTLSSEWVQSHVFTQGNTSVGLSYETDFWPDRLAWRHSAETWQAEQSALLRDDYVLSQNGDQLQVNSRVFFQGESATGIFGGLTLHPSTKTIATPDVSSEAGRQDLLSILLDGAGNVNLWAGGDQMATTNIAAQGSGADCIAELRLTRVSATTVQAAYSTDYGVTFTNLGSAQTVSGFHALGFLNGNARIGTDGYVTYDNLTLTTVPEPSSVAILVSWLIGLLAYAWRKRK